MSAEALISSMNKLYKLHKSLYELAVKKTDAIKQGDMDALNQLIKDEHAHIAAVGKVEKERQQAVAMFVPGKPDSSIMECIYRVIGTEREELVTATDQLAEAVYELKEQNALNQQLIYQSLQFTNFSLSLFRPQPESFNYGPPAGKQKQVKTTQGMFNSKV